MSNDEPNAELIAQYRWKPGKSANPGGRRKKSALEFFSEQPIPASWLKRIATQRGKNKLSFDFEDMPSRPTVGDIIELRLLMKAVLGDHRSIVEILNRRFGKPKSQHVSMHGSLKVDASIEMQTELETVHERLSKLLSHHGEHAPMQA